MYYNAIFTININNAHVKPMRHVGARVGPRGATTWP